MKKILSLFLIVCVVLGIFTLAGCSKQENVDGLVYNDTVPSGGTYIIGYLDIAGYSPEGRLLFDIGVEHKRANSGEEMPDINEKGGTHYLILGDYIYSCDNGELTLPNGKTEKHWEICAIIDKGKIEYEEVATMINGVKILSISNAFSGCVNMEKTPKLPNTIVYMNSSFSGCEKLKEITNIPKNVVKMDNAFGHCYVLEKIPTIPNSVDSMVGTFEECNSLKNAPIIPKSVKDISGLFAFSGVTGNVQIDATPEKYENCFVGVDNEINIVGDCEVKKEILNTK